MLNLHWIFCVAGSTERAILKNFEEIVERALPLEKVKKYYEECYGSSKQVVLDYVTFFEERIMVGSNIVRKSNYTLVKYFAPFSFYNVNVINKIT